jgi:hypothetical protein
MSKVKQKKLESNIFTIDTNLIAIPMWATPEHSIKKAYNDGKKHALNHYYGEECNPDWPCGVKSWAVNPYSENRPSAFCSWMAGFMEQWAELVRNEREEEL